MKKSSVNLNYKQKNATSDSENRYILRFNDKNKKRKILWASSTKRNKNKTYEAEV